MTLDAIVARYQDGTLASEPDRVLIDAQAKVAWWHDWRLHNPDARPDAVPNTQVLRPIYEFLENTLSNR